jgi:Response regulator containing a CheY-like receiver domain and an HTH DNA-binding domain
MSEISLILAVNSALFRESICKILDSEKDIKIIGQASNHLEIITLIEQKKPDVLFMDTDMLNVAKILQSIREKSAKTRVLLLLYNLDEETVIKAISLGVRGYLRSTSNIEQFVRAIRTIRQEEIWAERKILTKVVTRFLFPRVNKSVLKCNPTKREKEIAKLVIEGWSNKQIAKALFISEKTVKAHLGKIFAKLGISNRSDLTFELLQDISAHG